MRIHRVSSFSKLYEPNGIVPTVDLEISQVGMSVDNTIKTRFLFEINKGANKSHSIDVNTSMPHDDRRVPFDQMIYVADGPSDAPVFAVIKQMGGKAYAVYNPRSEREFEQSCELVERGRVHNNGPADYRKESPTSVWMKQKVTEVFRRMIKKKLDHLDERTGSPPKHFSDQSNDNPLSELKQDTFLEMKSWSRKSLLGLEDMNREEIICLLDKAKEFQKVLSQKGSVLDLLKGKRIINLFMEPSTRTRVALR